MHIVAQHKGMNSNILTPGIMMASGPAGDFDGTPAFDPQARS
jgi:hypothetical protein